MEAQYKQWLKYYILTKSKLISYGFSYATFRKSYLKTGRSSDAWKQVADRSASACNHHQGRGWADNRH